MFTAPLQLAYPYDRTVGPTLSRFFTGLRERRVEGTVGSDGRRYVPPAEFDPVTGHHAPTGSPPRAPGPCSRGRGTRRPGTGGAWSCSTGPMSRCCTGCWSTARTRSPRACEFAARWSAERTGGISDIEGFVPEGSAQPDAEKVAGDETTPDDEPVNRVRLPVAVTYEWSAGPRCDESPRGAAGGPPRGEAVRRVPPRLLPAPQWHLSARRCVPRRRRRVAVDRHDHHVLRRERSVPRPGDPHRRTSPRQSCSTAQTSRSSTSSRRSRPATSASECGSRRSGSRPTSGDRRWRTSATSRWCPMARDVRDRRHGAAAERGRQRISPRSR